MAEEVKGLDQPARATLRKYGVRFGAYHIYLPVLLEAGAARAGDAALGAQARRARTPRASPNCCISPPAGAPRSRSTRRRRSRSTAPPAIACAASARCASISWSGSPISSARRCPGARAAPAPKPDGAFDGRGFTVTGAMTSLTGASGEDFASILRSLGYRMDRQAEAGGAEPAEAKLPAADSGAGRSTGAEREAEAAPAAETPARPRRAPLQRQSRQARLVDVACCRMPNSCRRRLRPAARSKSPRPKMPAGRSRAS